MDPQTTSSSSPSLDLSNNDRLLSHLREIEAAAEEVLSDRQEIVDLDRRRNQTREAARAIVDKVEGEKRTWLALGNTFFKLPVTAAKEMLRKDQIQLDGDINVLRSNLKLKVNALREKEGQAELKGFDLRALSREEVSAVRQVIGPAPTWR